jgi:hypothetical protein
MERISVCAEAASSLIRHYLVRVAAARLRNVGHEFGAQRLFDALDDFLLHRFHLQHAVDAVERHFFGQNSENARGVLRAQLGEHYGHRLRVFVLEIVRQHLFLHVGELFPHVAAGGAADFVHDAGDAILRQELPEQALGRVVIAEQRAGGRQTADEFKQKLFDLFGIDGAERGHDDGDFAQFVIVKQREDLAAILLAERQHQYRGALRAGELAQGLVALRPAGELRHQVADVVADGVFVLGLRFGHQAASSCSQLRTIDTAS